jgi:hypothetical protein
VIAVSNPASETWILSALFVHNVELAYSIDIFFNLPVRLEEAEAQFEM